MMPPPSPTYQRLDCLLAGEVPLGEFESWVYATPRLEQVLGTPAYVDLLAFDYHQAHADLALAKLVQSIYDRGRPGFLLRDRAYRYAIGLVSGTMPLSEAVHGLANLWYQGYEWVWAEFAGISSDFDDYPGPEHVSYWEPNALANYLNKWKDRKGALEESARNSAREFLRREFSTWPAAEPGVAGDVRPGIVPE